MKVEVIQEDIDNGRRSSCSRCPIALAVARAAKLEEGETVEVTPSMGIKIRRIEGVVRSYNLCSTARRFIHLFDGGLKVKPFEFEAVSKVRVEFPSPYRDGIIG